MTKRRAIEIPAGLQEADDSRKFPHRHFPGFVSELFSDGFPIVVIPSMNEKNEILIQSPLLDHERKKVYFRSRRMPECCESQGIPSPPQRIVGSITMKAYFHKRKPPD